MTVCFVFKNGYELKMKCGKFKTEKTYGRVTAFEAENISENQIFDIDLDEVICIY